MKRVIVILVLMILMTDLVNAETITYNICKSGCEYDNFDNIINNFESLHNSQSTQDYDIVINFLDSDEYSANEFNMSEVSSIIVNGNNSTLETSSLHFSRCNYIEFNNLTINTENVMFLGNSNLSNYEIYNTYNKDNKYVFNNVTIDAKVMTLIEGTHVYSNSKIVNQLLNGSLFDLYFNNSFIDTPLFVGENGAAPGWDTNIYVYSDNTLSHDIFRVEYSTDTQNQLNNYNFNILLDKNNRRSLLFAEYIMDDNMKNIINERFNNPISDETNIHNNIYYYQDISKTITKATSITELENNFKNTYKNSIGYNDIKNKDIEWKSENEGIAKIDNGVIKPVSNGQVDLVGTRGNDIYTIHLTVDTLVDKEIEVPITGKKIKLWVLVSAAILFIVVGVCAYVLLKNKKAE